MIIKWLSRYCKACTGTKWHITFSSAISNFTLLDPVPYSIQTAKKLITTNIYWCLDEQTPSITKGGSGSRAYSGGQKGKKEATTKERRDQTQKTRARVVSLGTNAAYRSEKGTPTSPGKSLPRRARMKWDTQQGDKATSLPDRGNRPASMTTPQILRLEPKRGAALKLCAKLRKQPKQFVKALLVSKSPAQTKIFWYLHPHLNRKDGGS